MTSSGYQFVSGQRCILAEIYFPFRMETQGRVYTTLKEGLYVEEVQEYFRRHGTKIKKELAAYPHWFDPDRYGEECEATTEAARAKARLAMYSHVFAGWSMYEVNGVFFNEEENRIDQERTQVIRLIFKFWDEESAHLADDPETADIYRAILYWTLSEYGHTRSYHVWGRDERDRFLSRHISWSDEQKELAEMFYPELSAKVAKWIDDAGLFVFGYLVRSFWEKVMRIHGKEGTDLEDEIWVTSIFHSNVNVMEPMHSEEKPVTLETDQS